MAPSQIGGLQAWYKADALGLHDGDPVATWTDSSGRGHAASAPGAGQRPSLVAGAANGLAAVRFDGVDDVVQAKFALAQPATVVVVYRARTDTGANQYVTDGAVNGAMVEYLNSAQVGMYAGGAAVLTKAPSSFGTFRVLGGVFAGAASALYADGGPAVTGANPGTNTPGGITVGNSGGAAAAAAVDVAEVVTYDRALSPTEMDGLGRYLATRYGLPWTPVGGPTSTTAPPTTVGQEDFGHSSTKPFPSTL